MSGFGPQPGSYKGYLLGAMPSRHEDTLNRRLAASPLVRLVEGGKRWEAPDLPQGALPQNWGGTEKNSTFTCMVLKAKVNDRRKNKPLAAMNFVDLDLILLSTRWQSNNTVLQFEQ
ncbi:hypothetical protein TNCV_3233291 [Trichonephila clavipes]|nr:hypothetical protein TNCV_3233291 [Trichonephila clavipes]